MEEIRILPAPQLPQKGARGAVEALLERVGLAELLRWMPHTLELLAAMELRILARLKEQLRLDILNMVMVVWVGLLLGRRNQLLVKMDL